VAVHEQGHLGRQMAPSVHFERFPDGKKQPRITPPSLAKGTPTAKRWSGHGLVTFPFVIDYGEARRVPWLSADESFKRAIGSTPLTNRSHGH